MWVERFKRLSEDRGWLPGLRPGYLRGMSRESFETAPWGMVRLFLPLQEKWKDLWSHWMSRKSSLNVVYSCLMSAEPRNQLFSRILSGSTKVNTYADLVRMIKDYTWGKPNANIESCTCFETAYQSAIPSGYDCLVLLAPSRLQVCYEGFTNPYARHLVHHSRHIYY